MNTEAVAVETPEVKCNCILCRFTDVLSWPEVTHLVGIDLATGEDRTVRGNGKSTFHADIVETDYNADGKLKAYWVTEVGADFGMWIHAESAGKAKSIFLQENPFTDGPEFVDLRATRPSIGSDLLDVTPFTDYTLELARHPRDPEEQAEFPDAFLLTCPCSMCKYELAKPDFKVSVRTTSYHIKKLQKEMAMEA